VNGARLRHFRNTAGTREIDFVLGKGRSILAIEVKLSETVTAHDVRHLNWFEKEFSHYSVVKCAVTTGPYAYTRSDGTHVIPAVLLGA
jgi:predicted AAA+ superfamily ATPase